MKNMDSMLFPANNIFELAEVLANLSNEGFELLRTTIKKDYGLCVEKELIAKISTFANEQRDLLAGYESNSDFRRGEISAYSAVISFLSDLEGKTE